MKDYMPKKRPRSDFIGLRTLRGLSTQDKVDFSYADLRRYFKVKLWDRDHICKYDKCPVRGRIIETFEEATLDHIIPRSKGGRTRWANVQLMHKRCNSQKSSTILTRLPHRRFQKAMTAARSRRSQPSKYELKRRGLT